MSLIFKNETLESLLQENAQKLISIEEIKKKYEG